MHISIHPFTEAELEVTNEMLRAAYNVPLSRKESLCRYLSLQPGGAFVAKHDGMVIGFPESPEKPLLLAMEVSKGLIAYNKSKDDKKRVDIRVGLDSGPVFLLTDLAFRSVS